MENEIMMTRNLTATERAWWWEEVESGHRFREGEPLRREGDQYAEEYLVPLPFTVIKSSLTYFRDTRRTTPPPLPLKVGDMIETVEDLERLPVGAGVVDCDGDLAQKRDDGRWHYALSGFAWQFDFGLLRYGPVTVVYLPKAGGSDD